MKEIILDNEVIAYSYKFEPSYSKQEILKSVDNIVSKMYYVKSDGYTFTNIPKEFLDIYEFCGEMCTNLCKSNNIFFDIFHFHKWISILRNIPRQPMELDVENKEATYHNHYLMAKYGGKELPTYSFVYYLQMPDNLSGLDGKLLFKNDNNNILSYLPTENEILIFDSKLSHSPVPAKNSTKNRVVLAGDFIVSNRPKNKSLL